MSYNAKEFGEKHGKKYTKKVKEYGELGYLGKNYRNEKTGVYCIHESTPLPFDANKNVSKVQTLWLQILTAASECRSIFPSMYTKIPAGCFDRQIDVLKEAGFIRSVPTESGVSYFELLPSGYKFMTELTKKEQKHILDKIEKAISIGGSFLQTALTLLPFIQQCISNLPAA